MYLAEIYMKDITNALQERLGQKLLYVGLQGSYLRGEATEQSDIDVVVIVDELSAKELAVYKTIISELDAPEKSCGFICGKRELQKWNPLEICTLLHGTKDYYGTLAEYLPEYTSVDVLNFIKLSVGNLLHEMTHRYVHADLSKNISNLPYSYKQVFFILQNVYYLRTGVFYPTKKELLTHLSDSDRAVMEKAAQLAEHDDYDFEEAFSVLLAWCQTLLRSFE